MSLAERISESAQRLASIPATARSCVWLQATEQVKEADLLLHGGRKAKAGVVLAKARQLIEKAAACTPDFTMTNHGSILVLDANSGVAQAWVAEHLTNPETQTWGRNGTVIEPRYWADVEAGILADGLAIG